MVRTTASTLIARPICSSRTWCGLISRSPTASSSAPPDAAMKPAWTRPARASALPWPKRWSASAGISAWRTAKNVTREPTRSSDVSIRDDSMLIESVIHQAATLATIRIAATSIEAMVASRIRRWGSNAIVASGVEGARRPGLARRDTAVFQAVVQAERAILPEFDQQRLQAETRPVRRPRHSTDDVPGRDRGDALFQGKPALQRARLVRGPGADLAAAIAGREIGVGLSGRNRRHRTFQADLPAQRLPVKQQRRLGMGLQVQALAAFRVGVDDETRGVVAFQEDHADRGRAVGPDRGEAHGRGIIRLALGRRLVPFAEKRQRIGLFPNHDHNMRGCGRPDHRHLVPIGYAR